MNHKLRVLVRVDLDPVQVTLEISGCVTPSDAAALMHIVRRAGRLGAGAEVVIDLHGTSHLDPEVLLGLRRLADAGPLPAPDAGDSKAPVPFRLTLDEPAELPICLLHVGADAEVLAGLDSGLDTGLDTGLGEANTPLAAEAGSDNDLGAMNLLALSEYFEGTLDPAATVRALSDTALCQLADALYRHLDTNSPSFGAHTWYELAAEEIQNRHLTDGDGPAGDELEPDTALA
ncbi:hypothetical protein [Arthrobacter sp. NicSoilB8]|uniref:hypothetical protein n=1 Tax=Arthrobacter sp. NicSoilB8 TaxID=2830998 RepID=UPI001CC68588|nr:hypothetical protein [Arthrobacter sp. NicSoilB8]